ncbi:putative transporter (transmembrane protein) [Knoellia remsis]|uniref:Putative transporter (Transmembrane protein) n=1 Tax=Knoellia remsis TaxID=407159 RepID=A0A2T0TYM7_9MICO|nr:hypothetical protein [Knoellia remsis]PRY50796.1 putative transporter (transmembrane protein) [Knoellia remsis]
MNNDALDDAWSSIVEFAPKFLGFLAILIIGLIVAKLIGKAVDKLLERVGFDRWVERGGVKRALSNSSFDASDIVGKLVYYALVLFVLQMAFGVFGPNPISDLLSSVIAFIPKIVVAIVIIIVASAIAAGAKNLIQGSLGGLSYGRLLANIASIFILALGVIAALEQVEVATAVTTPVLIAVLATIGGVLVVGVGGGLVRPMQQRWEGWLNRMEREAPQVAAEARAARGSVGSGSGGSGSGGSSYAGQSGSYDRSAGSGAGSSGSGGAGAGAAGAAGAAGTAEASSRYQPMTPTGAPAGTEAASPAPDRDPLRTTQEQLHESTGNATPEPPEDTRRRRDLHGDGDRGGDGAQRISPELLIEVPQVAGSG